MKLYKEDEESKENFLFRIMNRFDMDLEVCYNYKMKDGSLGFSKWVRFLELSEYDNKDYIPKLYMTKENFIRKITHRSVLDIELMLDLDEHGLLKDKDTHLDFIINKLKEQNIEYVVYFTGSKSYHISILLPFLKSKTKQERTELKRKLINMFIGDSQKASSRCMISLEGEVHYKSGKIKKRVYK